MTALDQMAPEIPPLLGDSGMYREAVNQFDRVAAYILTQISQRLSPFRTVACTTLLPAKEPGVWGFGYR